MPSTEILQAKAGYFDGELKSVGFRSGESVGVLLDKLELSVNEGQEINDEAGNSISRTDQAVIGRTYYIVGNYKNG